MTSDFTKLPWGQSKAEYQQCTRDIKLFLRVPTNNFQKNVNDANNQLVKDILGDLNVDAGDVPTAKLVFQHIKNAGQTAPHMPLPCNCSRPPPNKANVYSDGSWKIPTKRFLGLGGAGVW